MGNIAPHTNAGRVLEIAANSLDSALAAQAGGAQRVELCAALEVGGLTPSPGLLALARRELEIQLYVLIRPRAGDMVYTPAEVDTMVADVEACVAAGCDGVVIGALDAEGRVDTATCRKLIAAAGPLGVTFHRAFDLTVDKAQALETIVALGCERILTSGGAADAVRGAARIATLVQQAAGRITIMPGAGVHADNLAALAQATGAQELHASAKRALPSRFRAATALPGMDAGEWRSDVAEVRALVTALTATSR